MELKILSPEEITQLEKEILSLCKEQRPLSINEEFNPILGLYSTTNSKRELIVIRQITSTTVITSLPSSFITSCKTTIDAPIMTIKDFEKEYRPAALFHLGYCLSQRQIISIPL